MLITLLLWFYMLAICWVYGRAFTNLVSRLSGAQGKPVNEALVTMAGLVLLTTLSSYFFLFAPIGLWTNVLLRRVSLPRLGGRAALGCRSDIYRTGMNAISL